MDRIMYKDDMVVFEGKDGTSYFKAVVGGDILVYKASGHPYLPMLELKK